MIYTAIHYFSLARILPGAAGLLCSKGGMKHCGHPPYHVFMLMPPLLRQNGLPLAISLDKHHRNPNPNPENVDSGVYVRVRGTIEANLFLKSRGCSMVTPLYNMCSKQPLSPLCMS